MRSHPRGHQIAGSFLLTSNVALKGLERSCTGLGHRRVGKCDFGTDFSPSHHRMFERGFEVRHEGIKKYDHSALGVLVIEQLKVRGFTF